MADASSIKVLLSELIDLPADVVSWEVEVGPDATQEPAVWVWATLAEDTVDAPTRAAVRDRVREAVRGVNGGEEWVYVRFRVASESAAQ